MKGDLIRAFFNKIAHDSQYHRKDHATQLEGQLMRFIDDLRKERGWQGDLEDEPPDEMGELDYVVQIFDETIALSIFNKVNALIVDDPNDWISDD